mmetsp:Transcript_41486/g.114177  ORF Transcript_41486/g.114177 Transcript_41486/m.114177 type:complete len:261 (+) Transcript_41486:103-885(+)
MSTFSRCSRSASATGSASCSPCATATWWAPRSTCSRTACSTAATGARCRRAASSTLRRATTRRCSTRSRTAGDASSRAPVRPTRATRAASDRSRRIRSTSSATAACTAPSRSGCRRSASGGRAAAAAAVRASGCKRRASGRRCCGAAGCWRGSRCSTGWPKTEQSVARAARGAERSFLVAWPGRLLDLAWRLGGLVAAGHHRSGSGGAPGVEGARVPSMEDGTARRPCTHTTVGDRAQRMYSRGAAVHDSGISGRLMILV